MLPASIQGGPCGGGGLYFVDIKLHGVPSELRFEVSPIKCAVLTADSLTAHI